MSQRMLRRIVTAGALTALLALSMPGQAEAREIGGWGGMLRWLNGFWGSGVSSLWPSAPADRPATKQGPGIDPNGKPVPDPPIPSGTTCGAACDQGPGIDPNG
jgi:hypothetical protein